MVAKVINLFRKPGKGQPMVEVSEAVLIEGSGIQDDAAFGRSRRQILIVEKEVLSDFGLQPGDVRENITIEGFSLDDLSKTDVLAIGETLVEITGDCTPCETLEKIRPGLMEGIRGNRGVLAKVAQSGTIKPGDEVRLVTTV